MAGSLYAGQTWTSRGAPELTGETRWKIVWTSYYIAGMVWFSLGGTRPSDMEGTELAGFMHKPTSYWQQILYILQDEGEFTWGSNGI